MKRKTSSTPTKIYTYGCRPPVDGADALAAQIRRAHAYRNGLVEIERKRRDGIAIVQRQHNTLGPLLTVIDHLETLVGDGRSEMKLLRSGGKGEQAARKDARLVTAERIRAILVDLSVLRWLRGWHKGTIREDKALKAGYDATNKSAYADSKVLRNGEGAPSWGTYLVTDKAAEPWRKANDPPRFKRFDGSGRAAVQLQGGLTVAEALSGTDSQLRILPATPRVKKDGSLAPVRDTYRTVKIRVDSDERKKPIWTTLPFVMHRPLPEDGVIKWAWIICRRDGLRYRYDLQLTVEAPSFAEIPTPRSNSIAIDIGTRDVAGEPLRAAAWLDSAGERGYVSLPTTRLSSPTSRGAGRRHVVPNALDKCEDLRSIRDKHLDAVKVVIVAAREGAPEWFREGTKSAHQWRSPARVGGLRRVMRENEVWNAAFVEQIDAYLKQDRHLLDWETRERRRHLNRRKDQYRVFAAHVACTYGAVVIAKRNYRRTEQLAEDGPASDGHDGRVLMRSASPGDLCAEVKRAVKSAGVRLIEVEIEGDTTWALDHRVCERLLTSAEAASVAATPLASTSAESVKTSGAKPRRRRLGTKERIDPLAGQDVSV